MREDRLKEIMTDQDAFPAILLQMEPLNNGSLVQPIDACRPEHDKSLSFYGNAVDNSCIRIKVNIVKMIEKNDPFDAVIQRRRSL